MKQDSFVIKYGKIPEVLLIGNGINRAYGFASWSDLIESIRTKNLSADELECMKNVPYPLQPVILTGDHLGTQMKQISSQLSDLCAPVHEEHILHAFASLPVDAILTTNYTYELEKSLDSEFKCVPKRRCKARTFVHRDTGKYNTEQLHTCFSIPEYPPIWHIHGEAAKHGTMVLGHYYYGKLLSKMQQYVSSLIARYSSNTSRLQDTEVYSWIDYFMLGDIHIIGLGMALSELDLWWLVNCKKRHFPDRKVILYKPDIKLEEKLLAEAYGVLVNTNGYTGDYCTYYSWLYEELKEKL